MEQRPVCRLCGSRHFAAELHNFGGEKPAEKSSPKKKSRKAVDPSKSVPAEMSVEDRLTELEDRMGLLENRKRYQKELMRKRRAEGKA